MAEYRLTVPITVRDLTQRADLGLVLSAGEAGGARAIKWAHAIELNDPTPYLFGGELVMTTGLTVGLSHAEQYEYAARLSGKNVAALAFDTGTTFSEVPPGILAAGDELGLPILQVPVSTPFIAITRAVIDELTADELRAVQRVVDQQDVLVRATLRDGAPGVVSALSRSLAATVIVTATDGTLLAEAGHDAEHLAEITRGAFPNHSRKHASRVVADRDGYCTIQTVRAGKAERGYLAVRSEDALTAAQRLLVSHAMALIAIELEAGARRGRRQRLRGAVTRALLADPRRRTEVCCATSGSIRIPRSSWCCCATSARCCRASCISTGNWPGRPVFDGLGVRRDRGGAGGQERGSSIGASSKPGHRPRTHDLRRYQQTGPARRSAAGASPGAVGRACPPGRANSGV